MICPKCGKDKTTSFVDVKDNTHGYHCEECRQDFGVDDGRTLSRYEDYFSELFFRKEEKDHTIREVSIKKLAKDDVKLYLTIVKARVRTDCEPIDFSPFLDEFGKLLFEKLFVLDWKDDSEGIVLEDGNESFSLEIRFRMGLLPTILKKGNNMFPPYEVALENIFESLFEQMENR